MPTLEEELAPQVRTMQIIVAAMAGVPLLFMVVAQVMGDLGDGDNLQILVKLGLAVGLLSVVMQNILGRVVCEQSAKSIAGRVATQPEALGGSYLSGLIVSVAICEGAAFLNLIAYLFEQSPWNLAMAGLLILVAASKFPTLGGVAAWVRRTVRQMEDEAELANSKMTNDQ